DYFCSAGDSRLSCVLF
nr:immunoglobulin light chain junction region [Macaca mulatta]